MSLLKRSLLVWLVLLVAPGAWLLAQEPFVAPEGIPPESNYVYERHYAQIQEILGGPLANRAANLEAFMKKLHPKSKALEYMEGFFNQIRKAHLDAGQTAQADAVGKQMARLFPDSKALQGQEFQQAWAAKNYAKVIELGEPMYAGSKDPNIAFMLAQSYQATGNDAKTVTYGTTVVNHFGAQKAAFFAAWLADYYQKQGNPQKALTFYDKIVKDNPNSPPEGWTRDYWQNVCATPFAMRGDEAYKAQKWKDAIGQYEGLLNYQPRNDAAYYRMGMSYWQLKEMENAMDAFAKATVLDGQTSGKAREYLTQIYSARNGGKTDGLDEFLAAARLAVGS